MVTTYRKKLGLNKIEAAILALIMFSLIMLATVHVAYLAKKLGANISGKKLKTIKELIKGGSSLATAFKIVTGIAVPEGLILAVAQLGIGTA